MAVRPWVSSSPPPTVGPAAQESPASRSRDYGWTEVVQAVPGLLADRAAIQKVVEGL